MPTGPVVDRDLLFPSRFAEVANRPHLQRLLHDQVDMQLDDLRSLLAMPIPDLDLTGGCNLTATILMCNVVAGASMLLFEASLESVRGTRGDSGARFMEILTRYYPWQLGDAMAPAEAARLLYGEMRNPLAHNLGVGKNRIAFPGLPRGDGRSVMLRKGPMAASEIEQLLDPGAPPPRAATITTTPTERIVDVDMLVWGTYGLLHALLSDDGQADFAEETAEALVTGMPVRYDAPIPNAPPDGWGEIVSLDEYEEAVQVGRQVIHVPPPTAKPAPALAHDGACGKPTRAKVRGHLTSGTADRYYWAESLNIARHAFRARRCLGKHKRPA